MAAEVTFEYRAYATADPFIFVPNHGSGPNPSGHWDANAVVDAASMGLGVGTWDVRALTRDVGDVVWGLDPSRDVEVIVVGATPQALTLIWPARNKQQVEFDVVIGAVNFRNLMSGTNPELTSVTPVAGLASVTLQ